MEDIFADYPEIIPGRITYAMLHRIIDWRQNHKLTSISHETLQCCYDEGQSAAAAGLELDLIDYGQASGQTD